MAEMNNRIRVSDDTLALLEQESDRTGYPFDTLIQLWGVAATQSDAADLAREALDLTAVSQQGMREELSRIAPNLRVTAIRLARWHESFEEEIDGYGFDRTHAGADLTTSDPQLWRSVRGHWAIGTQSSCIAAFRLGRCLALYGGVTWSRVHGGRRYALTGYLINEGQRVNPEDGTVIGAASADERGAAEYLRNHALAMPAGAANPVANLFG